MKPNYKFNRFEHKGKHRYITNPDEGKKLKSDHEYSGFIKCKLVHNVRYSLVVPDQVYLKVGAEVFWIQPLYFLANLIEYADDLGRCHLFVDISHGTRISVSFSQEEVDRQLDDGSFLYRCTIVGPAQLFRFATGKALVGKRDLYLELFHHTNRAAKKSIEGSAEFWASSWNIQGNKKLTNFHFLYLTPLPKIVCGNDLVEIAMSTHGKIALRLDQNIAEIADEIVEVYRESTTNRTETIRCWAKADQLAPQHVYRHNPEFGPIYYEVVSPFIHRVVVEPGTTVAIQPRTLALVPSSPKKLSYVVLGDATTSAGLRAPYDEEQTEEILKIDSLPLGTEIISHWRKNANSDLYSSSQVELASF